jgi:hypothetical protein
MNRRELCLKSHKISSIIRMYGLSRPRQRSYSGTKPTLEHVKYAWHYTGTLGSQRMVEIFADQTSGSAGGLSSILVGPYPHRLDLL